MSSSELTLFAPAVIVLLILGRRVWHIRLAVAERAWLPTHLERAELVYIERLFRARRPLRLTARVDRGYRHPNGVITLVELKTRGVNRPYLSDIIELSAQRVAVEAQTAEHVDDYGYILIKTIENATKKPHRVKLLSTEEVVALAKRREALLTDWKEARYARLPGLCEQCAFRQQCRPPSAGYAAVVEVRFRLRDPPERDGCGKYAK